MAREFTPSASQERALALFGLTCDDTHAGAKAVLIAAGLTENGIPAGLTPSKAKKLSDDDLRAAFGVQVADDATTSAAAIERLDAERAKRDAEEARMQRLYRPTIGQRRREGRERDEKNAALRAAGYSWSREEIPNASPLRDDWEEAWVLRGPDGAEVTEREALLAIGYQR